VKVVKNKVSPPFKQADFDILYGEGTSREGEIIDLGANLNIVEKSGAWYSYGGNRIGQGKDNTREYLRERPELALEIENKIRAHYGITLRSADPAQKGPDAANDEQAPVKPRQRPAKEA
jgi:recombination protein RecA